MSASRRKLPQACCLDLRPLSPAQDRSDLDDDLPDVQNLSVQGVGCGTAIVNFN